MFVVCFMLNIQEWSRTCTHRENVGRFVYVYLYTYQENMIKESQGKKVQCAGVTIVTK